MIDATANRPLRIFLCHASDDKPSVRDLHRRLRADGFAPWLDEEDLLPGQKWRDEIPRAVRNSDVVLVCLSQNSINKTGYVQKEIKFALDAADEQPEGTIFLIPLRLEDCGVPERLNDLQWVNFYDEDGYSRLLRALCKRAADLNVSTIPTEDPPPPEKAMLPGEAWLSDVDNRRVVGGAEFVRVPAGKFLMGSKANNKLAVSQEKPQHMVEIPYDYWIAKRIVTNDDFAHFVKMSDHVTTAEAEGGWNGKEHEKGYDWRHPQGSVSSIMRKSNHPVVQVSWHDATAYCRWVNNELLHSELNDLVLRLPTEAEWEKASRGEYGNEWPWGNEFDKNNCNLSEDGKKGTTPVGAYSPLGDSPYGAADMVGNVWEWCHSLYKLYPYESNDGRESEVDSGLRVVRGGAWLGSQHDARCTARFYFHSDLRFDFIGFRTVLAPPLS